MAQGTITQEDVLRRLLGNLLRGQHGQAECELVQLVGKTARTADVVSQEVRQAILALWLIEQGAKLLVNSPIHEDLRMMTAAVMEKIATQDDGLGKSTEAAQVALRVLDAYLNGDENAAKKAFSNPESAALAHTAVVEVADRLRKRTIRHD